jgi:hypothetical protein
MHIVKGKALAIGAILMALLLLGCEGDPASVDGQARVTVLLTDAPSDYIEEARVDIGRIEIIPAGPGAPILLSEDGTDGPVNLLELQNAATEALAFGVLEPGFYTQLRLIVESAHVVLAGNGENQLRFRDGDTEKALKVPSGARTGIKLNLAPAVADEGEEETSDPDDEPKQQGVEIVPGDTDLILDFDVHESFVFQGNPLTPAGIKGVLFKPTIRVIVGHGATTISGTVTTAVPELVLEGLLVTAKPVAGTSTGDFQTRAAHAFTVARGDGTIGYTVYFVIPGGDYTVSLTPPDGYASDPADVLVEDVSEDTPVEDVDFEVKAAG